MMIDAFPSLSDLIIKDTSVDVVKYNCRMCCSVVVDSISFSDKFLFFVIIYGLVIIGV